MSKGWAAVAAYAEEAQKRQKEYDENKGNFKPRAFPLIVKMGEEADVTFVDVEPDMRTLHTLQLNEKWTTRPCLGDNCPYCAKGNKSKTRCLFTVVDHRSYTREKDGVPVTYRDQLRYFECSPTTADNLNRMLTRKKKKLGTDGIVVNISKSKVDKKSPPMFDLLDRDPESHRIPENVEPFDFDEVFALDSATAFKEAVSGNQVKYS